MTTAEVQQVVVMVVHHEQMSKNEMEVVDDFGFTTERNTVMMIYSREMLLATLAIVCENNKGFYHTMAVE